MADCCAAATEAAGQVRGRVDSKAAVIDHDEIVAGAAHLGEIQGHNHAPAAIVVIIKKLTSIN